MKTNHQFFISIIFILIAVLFTGCSDENDEEEVMETIKIGAVFPFTLPGAEVSSQSRFNAVVLAADEINANGKIFDKELEIIAKDNEADNTIAKQVAQELIDEGVVAIVGPSASSRTLAMSDITIPGGVLLISPSATSPLISDLDDNDLVWRTAPSDVFQGKVAANYAYNQLGKQNAGILYINDSYGSGLAREFREQFEEVLGGTVLNYISYEDLTHYEDYDFTSKVDSLFSGNPELIYLISQAQEFYLITTSIGAGDYMDYGPQLLGCDSHHNLEFIINSPAEVIEGMIGLKSTLSLNNPDYQTYLANYQSRFGEDPASAYAANAYDALYLLAFAMVEANSELPYDIAQHMKSVSVDGDSVGADQFALGKEKIENGINIDYTGASGKVDLDDNGDVIAGDYVIWKIEDGQFVDLDIISYP